MPSISPITLLRSSDSSVSSCSDISVDANFFDRESVEESSKDCNQEDSDSLLQRHLVDSNLPVKSNGFHEIGNSAKHDSGEVRQVDEIGIIRHVETSEVPEGADKNVKGVDSLRLSNDEDNAEFWFPPESEDKKDDVIDSLANYDDNDDECVDSVNWAKSSSFSSFGEEGSASYSFKEEKLNAMNNVRNGKFRVLVSQLIKSVGVNSSGDCGENWVDIVASLSWEAAAFVKPETNEGKAMDPDGYVKVKCIATGLRTQSRLIKGLVFKKHAAHKRMATKYRNPRLLLIHGSLDLSSGGLSSFESMKQEKDKLKAIDEMIEMYHPNVILVEKSVSRDIQESILSKGVTLVFDMKLHRLERVARCIGSPIFSTEVAISKRRGQCDSFYIEKFVEEHDASNNGGKKPSKTLMFLEGCPSRLGCTIELMGANSDELKRIKCVIRCAVVMAYHLMLETSFLLDQSTMFSTISPGEVVDLSGQKDSDAETNMPFMIDIPISNRNSSFSFKSYNPAAFPGFSLSTSIQKVMNDNYPIFSDYSEIVSSPVGFDGSNQDGQAEDEIHISAEQNLLTDEHPDLPESSDTGKHSDSAEDQILSKDEISAVLDSESILVLMSSRNASKWTICEQSHFSHIKFYRSFDDPLGKFLHDNLLNQKLQCKTCGETPEMHIYYYAHHNKQLTIQVKHLPERKALPGETEGKLWMWSRCGQCKFEDGSSKCTKRVLISTSARGLSFGKFLELSFSNHSSFNTPSSCGHSFHKDFLYFFGLGPMVAIFKYSPVATHSVSLPPLKMESNASVSGDFLKKDSDNVYFKGTSMFQDIEKSLKDMETRFAGVTLNIQGSSKEFSDIVLMLKQEQSQFEVSIQDAVKKEGDDNAVCKLLSLNRIRLDLLLESYIWDRRLHALLSSNLQVIDTDSISSSAQDNLPRENGTEKELHEAIAAGNCDTASENSPRSEIKLDASFEADDIVVQEIVIDGEVEESKVDAVEGDSLRDAIGSSVELETHKAMSITEGSGSDSDDASRKQQHVSLLSDLENDKGSIWAPFADIRREYIEDLQRGYLPKIESFNSYAAESMPQKVIAEEGSRLHIPLGSEDYIVSDYEDEISSIIACSLTLLDDVATAKEDVSDDAQVEKGVESESNESSQRLRRVFSLNAPRWSSFGSLDIDTMRSLPTNLGDSSSFDGLKLLDSLVSYSASHPHVSMGLGKNPAKRKYSVLCLYSRQFRQLRDRCLPSEVDYIASLSRCRNWDAKGGKSKSFFAKTLDDRLIIKEIKKTEFDSFMKFATNYFEYMNQCYELGNQTCLAKILGIYQVVIRAPRNGKETRHDLLVMENLSFGRHIARQYDLKGALHARFNTPTNDSGDVLLDQNFVIDMNVSPLYVSRKSKRNLQRAMYNDTHFLNSINVMDYSLLVGVDTQRQELACGIIDYVRQYTWDKQLENWVKSSLVLPKNQLPTIISPIEYKKRFRKFIDTHFLSVPDHWCSQRSSNPCKLCGPACENGSLLDNKQERREAG